MSFLNKSEERRMSKVFYSQGWLQISLASVKKIRDFQIYLKRFFSKMAIMIRVTRAKLNSLYKKSITEKETHQ